MSLFLASSRQPDTDRDEAALMGDIAAGDRAAFKIMLERHMLPIYRFSYSIVQDSSLAEDITQESCLKLWDHSGKWAETGRVQSWLFRIAHNLCIDELRKRKHHLELDSAEPFIPPVVALQEHNLSTKTTAQAVKEALDTLPERQRTALVLVYYHDITNIEAARIMDISVDALESLLSRGKRGLKLLLSNNKHNLLEG